MNELNGIRQRIHEKKPVIGVVVSSHDSSFTEMFGMLGFHFVWIDGEHGPLDKRDILQHIIAAHGTGAASFVRVPWNDPVQVKPILDMGPSGIIFPMINTPEDARKAVASCMYPPNGTRGFGPRRAACYGVIDQTAYMENYSKNVWKIMQIEHVEAVDNLQEILEIDGIDAILIGPNDLSGSAGILGQTRHDRMIGLMDRIGRIACQSHIPFGVGLGSDLEALKQWFDHGITWAAIGSDFSHALKSAQVMLTRACSLFDKG